MIVVHVWLVGPHSPEVVHVPHLRVEHREEAEQQIEPDDIREVESKVPLVRK